MIQLVITSVIHLQPADAPTSVGFCLVGFNSLAWRFINLLSGY